MSMISGLIDELNKSADEWNASNMFELARMCREAADTIWELRDDLQRANAENAKLREELADAPKCETCEAMLDCDECLRADGSHKERRRISAENAKLREQSERLFDKTLELATENSKLRELCKLCEREADNAKLHKYIAWLEKWALDHASFGLSAEVQFELDMARRDLGVEVDG